MFCPICLKEMEVFDESEYTGKRFICNDCGKIVSIIDYEV
jgi:uncharacterized protein YbaR (Trm112 family)